MATGVRAGAGANRGEELHTCFILKEFGAERAAYRLQRIRESHLLSDIAQSNANLLAAGSAGRRYVVLDDVPPDVLSRGHGGFLRREASDILQPALAACSFDTSLVFECIRIFGKFGFGPNQNTNNVHRRSQAYEG